MLTSLSLDAFLAFGLPGNAEWIILLVLGLLIFGRRLPEVGRNIGKSIVEFKRGIKGISEEIEEESSRETKPADRAIADHSQKEGLPSAGAPAQTATEKHA
jgi:sec-independent protein translocase protein TatA